jgi:hypothetical protein
LANRRRVQIVANRLPTGLAAKRGDQESNGQSEDKKGERNAQGSQPPQRGFSPIGMLQVAQFRH